MIDRSLIPTLRSAKINPLLSCLFILLLTACTNNTHQDWSWKAPAEAPKEQATPAYWYSKPAVKAAASFDFQKLWDACERTAKSYQFAIDRDDYRNGILTTRPMVSPQIFEPWRNDVGNFHELLQSTLQTVRRTLRFEIVKSEGGIFVAHPKVLVEKLSQTEHRVTAVSEYRNFFNAPVPESAHDELAPVSAHYWYAIGRDEDLEIHLADDIRSQLRD